MKKWVLLSVALVLLLAVAACGGSKAEPTSPPPPRPTSSQAEAAPPTAAAPPTKSAAPPTKAAPPTQAPASTEPAGDMGAILDPASLGEPSNLQSYRSTMDIIVSGMANGQEVKESFHFLLEHTSDPLAQHIVMTGEGTDSEEANAIEMYLVEGMMYMKMGEQWLSVPANEGEALTEGMVAPSDLVESTCGWKNEGKTTVNGIKVEHWTLSMADMQKCAPVSQVLELEKLTDSGGDLYIAEDGGYMVQMDLFFEGEDLGLNMSDNAEPVQEGRMEIHYQLTDVNQPITIELPPEAKASSAPPEDIPIPDDAQEVNSMMGMITFFSPGTPQEVADFYKAEMPNNGWTEVSVDEMSGMFMLEYSKGDQSAKMVIQTDDEKQMTSVFITVADNE